MTYTYEWNQERFEEQYRAHGEAEKRRKLGLSLLFNRSLPKGNRGLIMIPSNKLRRCNDLLAEYRSTKHLLNQYGELKSGRPSSIIVGIRHINNTQIFDKVTIESTEVSDLGIVLILKRRLDEMRKELNEIGIDLTSEEQKDAEEDVPRIRQRMRERIMREE